VRCFHLGMMKTTCLEAPADATARTLSLRSGQLVVLQGALGQVVRVCSGIAWVTQEADTVDHVLGRYDEMLVDRAGRVVIQALRSAEVTLS
jgi:Protein of unknown function (DUF2917)